MLYPKPRSTRKCFTPRFIFGKVFPMPSRGSPNMMIRLEPEHKEALRQLAAEEGCDMTAIVRPLILKRLGREDREEVVPHSDESPVRAHKARPQPTIIAAGAALPLARKMVTTRFKKGK